ncbi:MAG TPA: class I adenylate-forming enzyme family protein [Ilumatobacteraceae bacterium]
MAVAVIPQSSPQSLADYLWHWERTSPNATFVVDDEGVHHTYVDVASATRNLAAEFARRGLVLGDRVAVIAENSPRWITAFLAAIAGGFVAVPLGTRLTIEELDVQLDHADPGVIAVDDDDVFVGSRWSDRLHRACDVVPRPPVVDLRANDAGAAACLTYTSGTTGRPKGVLLSNANLVRASETYAAIFHSTPSMHTIAAVPLCHNTGFIDQLGHALVAGASIETHRRFKADRLAEAVSSGACTYFIGVPTMYHRMIDHLANTPPSERAPWLAFGGAPMPSETIASLQHHFPRARLANCYGLSEATSITHVNFVDANSAATEVGVAVAGTIDRVSMAGELLVRSPTTMLEYYRDPTASAMKFEDGWLRTGDLASRRDDGAVEVYGRIDDLINRGGEKVMPLEVEEVLRRHPAVLDAAVVGLPDREFGAIVVAAVVTRGSAVPADLGELVETSLAHFKRPAHIVRVEELPSNSNGKVVRSEVRELLVRTLTDLGRRL